MTRIIKNLNVIALTCRSAHTRLDGQPPPSHQPTTSKRSTIALFGLIVLGLSSCFIQSKSVGGEEPGTQRIDGKAGTDTEFDALPSALPDEESDNLPLPDDGQSEAQEEGWRERSFAGHSQYTITRSGDSELIRAETNGQASVLYRQTHIDLKKTPIISWRWKVSDIYQNINEREQSGDDYPARLYVVVQTGLLPWETLAINYVWSSTGRKGDSWDNAFTNKAKMVALRAGSEQVGVWLQEQRNVVEDFDTYFNLKIDQLDGYAIMIDGDNSGQSGLSWFSDIGFFSAKTQ